MNARDHLDRLKAMIAPNQQTWDLSPNDVAALTWAVSQLAASEREVSLLREHYCQIEPDIERADRHERDLKEIGRMIGCDHLDEGYLRCVRQRIDEGDAKARADLEKKLAACHKLLDEICCGCPHTDTAQRAAVLLWNQKVPGRAE